jgi:serine/threonine protein kinase/tetratricopeptide (TPR) repeat protein
MIGQIISHYKILEKLGEGGMGVVYRAEDTKLKRTVALKFLPRGLEAQEPERARFLQEAQAAAALNHPNICTIYDIAESEGPASADASAGRQQFIVMEYVDGQTLSRKAVGADHRSALKVNEAITYAIQIGEALQEAHSKGIVHRDIKTDNIMVNAKNQIKVMDFGLAKLKGSLKLTKTSSTVGTLAYMAPEQIQGEQVDARSDIFSFGVVLYEMLTGHLPFRGEHEAAMMYSILNEEPESLQNYLPDAPSELLHVLNRALEKDAEERYQTVHEMLIDLRRLKKETTRVVRPAVAMEPSEGLFEKLRKPSEGLLRKKWMRPSAIAGGALVVLALAYFLIWPLMDKLLFRSERIPIAIITFENQTGDPQFDYLRTAIPNLLTTSLEQSTALRVTTWERMRDLLKQMGKADVQVINTDLGFELCRKDSVRALVTGSFVKMGDMFATDVKVLDVESKALLKSASSKGEGVGSILKVQIDELGREIAKGIGLPEARIASEQKVMTEVTTTSLEAYSLYLRGVQDCEKFYFAEAERYLQKAIDLDSTFGMAHYWLAQTYSALGNPQKRRVELERALKFSNKASRKERLFIEAACAGVLDTVQGKRYRLLKQIELEFPNEKGVHYLLSFFRQDDKIARLRRAIELDPSYGSALNELAYEYARREDYEQSLEYFRRYATVSPGDANPYDSMAEVYFWKGKLDESLHNYKQAEEMKPGFCPLKISYLYAFKEEYDEAKRWIEKHPVEDRPLRTGFEIAIWRSFYEFWLGSNTRALRIASTAMQFAKKLQNPSWQGFAADMAAMVYVDLGSYKRAGILLDSIWALSKPATSSSSSLYIDAMVTLLHARIQLKQGNAAGVEGALANASQAIQGLTGDYKEFLTFLHYQVAGELLASQEKTDEAIRHFRNPPKWPKAYFSFTGLFEWYNLIFPRNLLAKAYLQKGDVDSAIAEYERITSFNPASQERGLIHPLHRYELAKLYEKKGLKDKAIAQYERFLTLWKNADADRPEPKDARARLARMRERRLR